MKDKSSTTYLVDVVLKVTQTGPDILVNSKMANSMGMVLLSFPMARSTRAVSRITTHMAMVLRLLPTERSTKESSRMDSSMGKV